MNTHLNQHHTDGEEIESLPTLNHICKELLPTALEVQLVRNAVVTAIGWEQVIARANIAATVELRHRWQGRCTYMEINDYEL